MGNILSYSSKGPETKGILQRDGGSADSTTTGRTEALYLDDIEAEPANWSQEGRCTSFQRLIGLLPDSKAERLKQEQRVPVYAPRVVTVTGLVTTGSRTQAIVTVQRVYRRYRNLRKWRSVAFPMLDLARSQLDMEYALHEENELLANFREILATGFAAQKVSISGELKNVVLQLVLKADEQDCYLTWSPSRKRQPRINLHDIEEVIPVLKEGNKHAPRLANKVSHRRGFIIVCKSHHRGRVILQVSSKRERKVLLLGFQRLLEDLNKFEPELDDAGALRKRLPRRKSVIQFFDGKSTSESVTKHSNMERRGSIDRSSDDSGRVDSQDKMTATPVTKPSLFKRHSTSIDHFYQTRFDDATKDQPKIKPSLFRRSSMTVGARS